MNELRDCLEERTIPWVILLKGNLPTGKASPGLWGGLTHLSITKSLPLNLQPRKNYGVEVGVVL
jgi:hypothetical protein